MRQNTIQQLLSHEPPPLGSTRHVALGRNGLWQFRYSNLESGLDGLENVVVVVGGDKDDRKTLGTESASSSSSMQVRVSIRWTVVADRYIDSLHIDTSTKDVRGDQDSLLKGLECSVPLDSLLLR